MRKRIMWIDIIKYICIMCVIFSHLESGTRLISQFFSPFFLTSFFFCSGYTYKHEENFNSFFKKKVKQLLIPWFFLSNLNILLSQIISFNHHSSWKEEAIWNFLQVRGYGDGLWFINALFVAYIPFYFIIKCYSQVDNTIKRALKFLGVISIFALVGSLYSEYMISEVFPWESVALPWHIEYIPFMLLYMFLGFVFRELLENRFDIYNTIKFRFIVCSVFVIYVVIYEAMVFNPICKILFRYMEEILGIVVVISLCKRALILNTSKYISYIGKNTLLVFAFHGKIYSLLETILEKLLPTVYCILLENVYTSSLLAIIITFTVSLIVILPIYIVNRYIPFLSGNIRLK